MSLPVRCLVSFGRKRYIFPRKGEDMSFLRHACLVPALLAGVLFAVPASAAPAQDEAAQLKALLKAHPEILIDVLSEHSEELLDIVQKGSEKRRRSTLRMQWENDLEDHKQVDVAGRPVGGASDAPVTIVAYSDFLCSYCHQAAFTLGSLMKRYPGKIRMVYKQIPKNEAGRIAGLWFLTAYRTDKAKAWKMYALTYDRQQAVEADVNGSMRAIAQETGFDVKKLEADMKKYAQELGALMDADAAEASRLGFVGTPYFLVNDIVVRGALSLENFSDAVDMALAHIKKKK